MRSGGMSGGAWLAPQSQQRQDRQILEETIRKHKAAQLAHACTDIHRVRELLSERADPNTPDNESRWPLQQAAFAGEADVVSLLLEARANPNLPDEGDRAIHVSSWQGDKKVTTMLLESSADVEATDSKGYTPLCGAAYKGHVALVELLLAHNADPQRGVNVSGHGTLTPLKAAQEGRYVKVMEVLKEAINSGQAPAKRLSSFMSTPQLGVRKMSSSKNSPDSRSSHASRRSATDLSSLTLRCLAKCQCCQCCPP
mmetsp:Transcript_49159/g.117194  ORF Transcript_49159/g.117194 Transcript_49159/m.117194 type:complete len:255 (+) Transcript_49159:74-838(+)